MSRRDVIAEVGRGEGGAALPGADFLINLGVRHPSTNGLIRLALTLEGDRIVRAEPIVGFLHRGAEKLFEVRDYRQILALANRHDWLASFGSELGVCLVVEDMMGIEVPSRATWLRTLIAELTRVLHHLHFLGGAPLSTAASAVVTPLTDQAREQIQALMEEISGGRVHFMLNRVGGLAADAPDAWDDRVARCIDSLRGTLSTLDSTIRGDDEFCRRTQGIGVLTADDAQGYGASGPVARASGLDLDLRRDDPYAAYADLTDELRVITADRGDCAARFSCLLEQCAVSLDLVEACLARLPSGPVDVRLPKIVRAPEGHAYAWTENPAGLSGWFLVSHGEKTPWRLKMRTASYANVQALPAILTGAHVDDLPAVLASLFFIVGDIDK